MKDKNDDIFRLIDFNSEEYKGILIFFFYFVLVVKGKGCLENYCF